LKKQPLVSFSNSARDERRRRRRRHEVKGFIFLGQKLYCLL
jgi:hypothetical protein